MRTIPILLALIALAPEAMADDVTLKSGRVQTELTLISETKNQYVFEDEQGRTVRIAKDSVASIEKKPTKRGAFLDKRKALSKDDIPGHLALAAEAREAKYERDAKELFQRVLAIDKENEAARLGLGEVKVDGKWLSAAEAERQRAAAEAKVMEARGWKKLGQEWLSPAAFHRQKEKLVLVQGMWVTSADARNIESKGLTYFEGAFYSPEDMKKIEAGQRLVGGNWTPITELDARFRADINDPWVLVGRGVEVRSNASYERVKEALASAEQAYADLARLFGEEPPDLYTPRGRIVVWLARNTETYAELSKDPTIPKRAIDKQRCHGSYYSPTAVAGRGAVITFAYAVRENVDMWIRNGVTIAFLDRLRPWDSFDPGLSEALAGFVAGHTEGRYQPSKWLYDTYLWTDNPMSDKPEEPKPLLGVGSIAAASPGGYANLPDGQRGRSFERKPNQAGLFMAFLQDQDPEAFTHALVQMRLARKDGEEFASLAMPGKDKEAIDQAWAAWYATWRAARQAAPAK